MYSGDAEGEVHIWRTKGDGDKGDDYSLVYVIRTGMPSVLALQPHPTQPKLLVLGPGDGGLCMYRTNRRYNQESTFERCGGLSVDSVRVTAVLSPDGRFAMSGSVTGACAARDCAHIIYVGMHARSLYSFVHYPYLYLSASLPPSLPLSLPSGRAIAWKTGTGRQCEEASEWASFDGASSSGTTESPAAMNCVAWSPIEHAVAIGGLGPAGAAPPVLLYSA